MGINFAIQSLRLEPTLDRPPPPRPASRPGFHGVGHRDLVGPENEDVTDLDMRQIVLRGYDAVLHLKAGIRLEMDMLNYRLKAVEEHLWPGTQPLPVPGHGHPHAQQQEWDRRRHVDPLTEFSPESTQNGSTKLPPGMFEALQLKVTRLEAEKAESEAYAAGQEDARRGIEKTSDKRWSNARKWIAILVPLIALVFGGVGFLVKHLIDNQPTPVYTPPKLDK